MKPSELLELCMELNAPDFFCSMDVVGGTFGVSFSLRYQSAGKYKPVYFEHRENDGSLFFKEDQVREAAKWLNLNHDKARGKA